nr:anti-sigma regulatory factor [Aphanothece sacrum]
MFEKKEDKNNSLIKEVRLQLRTELTELEKVLVWFEKIAHPYLVQECLWKCKLALAEGFTNTVIYAHKDLPPVVPIIVEVNLYSYVIEIRIWDIGPKFDLLTKLAQIEQDKSSPLEKENYRGLFFMKNLTDELNYIRVADRRNCLILRKHFQQLIIDN